MIQSLIHTSENKNSYIYDHQFRLSMLIHPELIKAHEKLTDVNPYYCEKYAYLKKNGFFSKPKSTSFGTISESMIKESIVQTPQITFEVTDFCNLNCSYCSFGELYEGFDDRNIKNIDVDYAVRLLKYIFDIKPKNKDKTLIIGFYGGEPLFNGNFVEKIVGIVNQLKSEKEMIIEYNMTTNATLVHKYIELLVENNFDLLISLDGNEENHSYRSFRKNKENSFRKVIENIDMIQRDYPEYFTNHVRFNAVLHNKNSVKDIYEFIYKRYNKIPRIAQLAFEDVKPDKRDLYYKMFHSASESEVEFQKEKTDLSLIMHSESSIYKELTNFLKYCSVNSYVSDIMALLYEVEKYLPTSSCLPGQKKILLTTHNKLLPCERVNYKYAIGEVNENVMLDISGITRRYKYYYDHIKNVCQNCYANRFCNICMFHLEKLDKIDTEDFSCEYFCDIEDFKNRLYRVFSFLEKYPSDFSPIIENVKIL